jgi:hypothetical protein
MDAAVPTRDAIVKAEAAERKVEKKAQKEVWAQRKKAETEKVTTITLHAGCPGHHGCPNIRSPSIEIISTPPHSSGSRASGIKYSLPTLYPLTPPPSQRHGATSTLPEPLFPVQRVEGIRKQK